MGERLRGRHSGEVGADPRQGPENNDEQKLFNGVTRFEIVTDF